MSSRNRRSFPLRLPALLLILVLLTAAAVLLALFFRGSRTPAADAPAGLSPPPMSTQLPPAPPETDSAAERSPAVEDLGYDFTQPVPEGEAVDDAYFADAVFIGDSRTAGFMLYSGLTTGDSLTHTGLSIFDVYEGKACIKVGGKNYTLIDALNLKQYGKIYLCLGVNELGYNTDDLFYQAFCDLVDQIRASQPDAVIYLQTLIPLNEQKVAESGGRDYLKNDHLRIYNGLIAQTAADKQVALVDVYSDFADENDSLPEEASNDGVHLNRSYCVQWLDYLKTHTVDYDTLYPNTEEELP